MRVLRYLLWLLLVVSPQVFSLSELEREEILASFFEEEEKRKSEIFEYFKDSIILGDLSGLRVGYRLADDSKGVKQDIILTESNKKFFYTQALDINGNPIDAYVYADSKFLRLPGEEEKLRVRLDRPKGEKLTIYKKPGATFSHAHLQKFKDCDEVRARADEDMSSLKYKNSPNCKVAWPDTNSKMQVLKTRLVQTEDPYSQEVKWELFYNVRVTYSRNGFREGVPIRKTIDRIGWISSSDVELVKPGEKQVPQVRKRVPLIPKKKEPCLEDMGSPQPVPQRNIQILTDLLETINQSTRETIAKNVGDCLMTKKEGKVLLPKAASKKVPYQRIMPEHWKKKRFDYPSYNGKKLSPQDFLAIDTMARTLYGEMASCYKYGDQYPMAVAAVINNRVKKVHDYRKKKHKNLCPQRGEPKYHALQTDHTCIMAYPKKFSVWNPKHEGKENPALRMALCPPKSTAEISHLGRKPHDQLVKVWKKSVEIATAAYLEGEKFGEATKEVNNRFYTSDMGQFYNMEKYSASIQGHSLDRSKCIELWRPSTEI